MSDMRYAVTITASEVMAGVFVSLAVHELAKDPLERDRIVRKRTIDATPESEPGSADWIRDVLVEVIEHL